MKQENNKVADKLQDGLEDITFGEVSAILGFCYCHMFECNMVKRRRRA
jgi:hypothetical protein